VRYRPDIDGLRAISILLVTIFHFDLLSLGKGGFIGVDIFFVISGFLITNIILSDLAEGRFTLGSFYARRVKRLYPALLTTLLLYLAAGYLLFLPDQFRELGVEALLSQLYVVNIYFWRTVNYFGLHAGDVPLLHMWSLAVEEQFYLLYPLFCLALYRWRSRWVLAGVLGVTLLSFLLGVLATPLKPSAAFYLLPTRAWELLAGGVLALVIMRKPSLGSLGAWSGWAGLALIGAALYMHTPATGVPGWFALFPVAAGLLLIAGGGREASLVTRGMSLSPMVWIGKISYPLYLVHWPVLQILQDISADFSWSLRALGFGLSFILAWAIYALVEQPIRSGRFFGKGHRVLMGSAGASGALIAFSAAIVMTSGMPSRFSNEVNQVLNYSQDKALIFRSCQSTLTTRSEPCRLGHEAAVPTYLVFGDSHANAFAHAFDLWLKRTKQAAYFAYETGCLPVHHLGSRRCNRQAQAAQAFATEHPEIETVVLVSIWRQPYEGGMLHKGRWTADSPEAFAEELPATVAAFKEAGKSVALVEPLHAAPAFVPQRLAKNLAFSRSWPVDTGLAEHEAVFAPLNKVFEIAENQGVHRVSLTRHLCSEGICPGALEGRPVFSDNNHLADWMSETISGYLEKEFSRLKN
jgi:peptidoglycan/LPS O-acetylase OafA/YrhL